MLRSTHRAVSRSVEVDGMRIVQCDHHTPLFFIAPRKEDRVQERVVQQEVSEEEVKEREQMKNKIQADRWPENTIPVSFAPDYPNYLKFKVKSAMRVLNDLTCLNYREAKDTDSYVVKVNDRDNSCSAIRGYKNQGGPSQEIILHPNCFLNGLGIPIHELMHASGIGHQQRRPDRDNYITIHEDRIVPDLLHNFERAEFEAAFLITFGLPYDLNSLMQYPTDAFINGTEPSITVNTDFPGFLGQDDGPSRSDVATINRLYSCWDDYLGNDIVGALQYKDFYDGFMSESPEFSESLREWTKDMKSLIKRGKEIAEGRREI